MQIGIVPYIYVTEILTTLFYLLYPLLLYLVVVFRSQFHLCIIVFRQIDEDSSPSLLRIAQAASSRFKNKKRDTSEKTSYNSFSRFSILIVDSFPFLHGLAELERFSNHERGQAP